MQRILLYEFVTSGGTFGQHTSPSESIRREGLAMMMALAADFGAVDGLETLVMLDERLDIRLPGCRILPVRSADEEFAQLAQLARQVDWVLIVAPEFDDLLCSRCRLVEESGGRLLGPSSCFVALAADKQRTAEHLAAAGVNVPEGISLALGNSIPNSFSFPAVLKPRFGAGSEGVRLILEDQRSKPTDGGPWAFPLADGDPSIEYRLERFCPGLPASVAFLCGPTGRISFPPCRQRLSDDGRFRYLGGSVPLQPDLARRATAIAHRAVASLAEPLGYLGIDMVLGDEPDGRNDVVVEVNPRLTTSYVGLRALANDNLAAAMLALAAGKTPGLSFKAEQLEFDADGTIRFDPKNSL
jgi:predicted ATP-grasp superfamily ATP-dependent carboligase